MCLFHLTDNTHKQHSTTGSSTNDVSCDAVCCVTMAMLKLDIISSPSLSAVLSVLYCFEQMRPRGSSVSYKHSLHRRGSWETSVRLKIVSGRVSALSDSIMCLSWLSIDVDNKVVQVWSVASTGRLHRAEKRLSPASDVICQFVKSDTGKDITCSKQTN